MSEARTEILARVRAAKASAAPTAVRTYRRAGDLGGDELMELFVDRVVDYKAAVHRCAPADAGRTIERVLNDAGALSVVVPSGLPLDLRPKAAETDPGGHGRALERYDAVVTTVQLAIAETGTFVIDHSDPAQGRRAVSLVPDIHVCVIGVGQIVETVPEGFAGLDPRHHQTWVSGPSATSDIELDRVEGVHGPRTLIVVLVGEMGEPPAVLEHI